MRSLLGLCFLAGGRAIRVDLNAGDCSFFLNYRDNGASKSKIARFHADVTLDTAAWATMPGDENRIFAIDFVIPAAE